MTRANTVQSVPLDLPQVSGAIEIPLDQIVPDPTQPRRQFDAGASAVRDEVNELKRLADNIVELGIIQPIRVRQAEDGTGFVIIAGERRWRAAAIAGLKTIPCTIAEGDAVSPLKIASAQLAENIHRKSLEPLEIAAHLECLATEHNLNGTQLAAQVGLSATSVSRHRALLKAEGPAKQALDEGLLRSAEGYHLFSKLSERAQTRLLKQARKDKLAISPAQVTRELSRAQGRSAGSPDEPTGLSGAGKRQPETIALPSLTRIQCALLFTRLELGALPDDPQELSAIFLQALSE